MLYFICCVHEEAGKNTGCISPQKNKGNAIIGATIRPGLSR